MCYELSNSPLDFVSSITNCGICFITPLLPVTEDGANKDVHLASQEPSETSKDEKESEDEKCDCDCR